MARTESRNGKTSSLLYQTLNTDSTNQSNASTIKIFSIETMDKFKVERLDTYCDPSFRNEKLLPLNYIRKYHRLKKQSKLNSNIPEVDFDTKFTNMNLTSYLNMNSSATQRIKNKNSWISNSAYSNTCYGKPLSSSLSQSSVIKKRKLKSKSKLKSATLNFFNNVLSFNKSSVLNRLKEQKQAKSKPCLIHHANSSQMKTRSKIKQEALKESNKLIDHMLIRRLKEVGLGEARRREKNELYSIKNTIFEHFDTEDKNKHNNLQIDIEKKCIDNPHKNREIVFMKNCKLQLRIPTVKAKTYKIMKNRTM